LVADNAPTRNQTAAMASGEGPVSAEYADQFAENSWFGSLGGGTYALNRPAGIGFIAQQQVTTPVDGSNTVSFAVAEDVPLITTPDGRTILLDGRVVTAEVSTRMLSADGRPVIYDGFNGPMVTGDDPRTPLVGRQFDTQIPVRGAQWFANENGSPLRYSFGSDGATFWRSADGKLMSIPEGYEKPSLYELGLMDPTNPFNHQADMGRSLGHFGALTGLGAGGLGVIGAMAPGYIAFAADATAYGPVAAYMMHASTVNTTGLVAAELAVGYDAASPNSVLLSGSAATALKADSSAVLEMFRRTSNQGAFAELPVMMNLKTVRGYAEEADIGLEGFKLRIIRDEDLLGTGLYGYTHPNGKSIDLYPDAFSSAEELVRTLGHERTHVYQTRMFGRPESIETLHLNERAAYSLEDSFVR
jgi:hypothetical protein